MVGRIYLLGWNRVKVSENLGATAVATVVPEDTSHTAVWDVGQPVHWLALVQGLPFGFDLMYLALADRNMQVRFSLKVVGES